MKNATEKIRVLHVVHNLLRGGIEGFMWYLTNHQKLNPNLETTVLCCTEEREVRNLRIPKNGIHCLFVGVSPRDINPTKLRQLVELSNTFDIIHFHIFIPPLNFALATSKAKKIYTIHNSGDSLRPKTLFSPIKTFLFKRFINRQVDLIVNNSHYTKKYWLANGIRATDNVVVPNGVEINSRVDQSPGRIYDEFPSLQNNFIIGTTSRLIKWKRVDLLLNAFSRMRNKSLAKLLIVGDGEERVALEKLTEELGLSDAVVFSGYRENVGEFQNLMDVCVFASVSEPFGLVAVECLNRGKPVVVMKDGGGLEEIVNEIEPENIADGLQGLADVLDKKIETRDELRKASVARKTYSERFGAGPMESEYFRLYQKVQRLDCK